MYETIKESIKIAEESIGNYRSTVEETIIPKSADIIMNINDYIHNKLIESDFPDMFCEYIDCMRDHEGRINPIYGTIKLSVRNGCGRMTVTSEDYNILVTFDKNNVRYLPSKSDIPGLCLIKNWSRFKEKINTKIELAFKSKIAELKRENEEIKFKEDLIKNFKL